MVTHVRIVAVLMILNGALTSFVGLFVGFSGAGTFALERLGLIHRPAGPQLVGTPVLGLLSSLSIWLGLPFLAGGVLNIVAGVRAWQLRDRVLVLVALLFGALVSVPTLYCIPTSLGVFIYGVVLFFRTDTIHAFAFGDEEVSGAEVPKRYPSRARLRSRGDDSDEA